MGVVYEVVDRERNAPVALKTLRSFSPDALIRFKNEFRALQDLHHENLVSLGELFERDGRWFFTMELVRGVDFMRHVRPSTVAPDAAATVDELELAPPSQSDPTRPGISPARAGDGRGSARPQLGALDEARLRRVLPQLVRAVFALHQAGKVHRDLKPSNILVTAEDRLVVLDFGLVVDAEGAQSGDGKIIGTVGFMAPEQANGRRVGAEADWYSVGVLLYLALTGRLPFVGRPDEVVERQEQLDPVDVMALAPEAPVDLAALAMDLLRRAPTERPTGSEVLARLRLSAGAPSARSVFVGRRRELAELADAFARVLAGHGVAVYLQGESGVGKSALVQHFTDQLQAEHTDVVVLAGRCYERESVPYKAFDGLIDELTQFMERLSDVEGALIMPRNAALLRQAFPQLGRVARFAEAVAPTALRAQPHELRLLVFAALRELLARLRDRRPLVLVIDDIQWADADSLALLAELLREPDAPPLLLLSTVRSDLLPVEGDAALRPFVAGDVRRVQMGGLPADDAQTLAGVLLGGARAAAEATTIANESNGHPLFIAELVRSAASPRVDPRRAPKLDEALWERVERLAPDSRRIVEAVAVAGAPLFQSTAARVTALELGSFTQHVTPLRAEHLVRTRGGRASDLIEPYHDRVRRAVLAHLPPDRLTYWHRQLAAALEASGSGDPEAIANHWCAAGDPGRAAAFAVRAAEQAARALAFDRAARLYQLALELRGDGGDHRELLIRLAESLANAGRGHAAAEAYAAAALRSQPDDALDLQRHAAQHLLYSGYIDEGQAALVAVLGRIGMQIAATPRRALTSLLWHRARIRLRGLRFVERALPQIPPAELVRVDTCYSVAIGLSLVDIIRGAEFQARHILLALDTGEPARVARALAIEASFASSQGAGSAARTELLLDAATRLANQSQDPLAQGWAAGAAGFAALQQGRWKRSREQLLEAEQLLRERCTGVWWELATVQAHLLFSLVLLGEFAELGVRGARYLREADERGDLFASTLSRLGPMANAFLAADDPAGGEADAERALGQWSQNGYHLQHFYAMTARASYALYRGDPMRGRALLDEARAPLDHSLLLRFQINRIVVAYLRARCALAAAVQAPPSERAPLERVVRRQLRVIEKEHMGWSDPIVPSLRAGLALLRGATDEAVRLLGIAERGFEAADMRAYQLSARRWRGALGGGPEGRVLRDDADAQLLALGARSPERTARFLLPGFSG